MGRRLVAVWVLRGLVALLALWAAFRLLGLESGYPLVAAVAFTPYVTAIGVLVLAVAVWARRWSEALAAVAAVALLAVAVLPRAVPGQPTGPIEGGARLDVLTVNLHLGEADAGAVVELARGREVDLLCAQELTAAAAERLREAGIDELLPERVLSPAEGSSGAGIYSRYPLRPLADVPGGISRMLRARVAVPGAGAVVEVVDVHPFPPTERDASNWRRGLEALPRAEGEGPIRVLAGDFNAGFDHSEFRDLVGSGYVDAAAARGRGLVTTWPADRVWPPPVAIDHVLAEERAHVAGAEVLEAPGSDHRPVLAGIVLPRRERG
jgi:endonuclease/exonuclease/phosphatase (EEP) superfamily protein YafD